MAAAALGVDSGVGPGAEPGDAAPTPAATQQLAAASTPLLSLLWKGGWLMAPIAVMSVVVVAVAIERLLGLRRRRVAPRPLARALRQLADVGDFEPLAAERMCRMHPSSMATIVSAMISKAGRPHAEVQAAAAEASQREADRLYSNVRTLNLAAAVTPLMGLLGTVWGMIAAFFVTASMPLGSNKGQALAEGIYMALVTTFAGLAVAIPAAMLAHFFEGRILSLLRTVEELLSDLTPRMERFEGGARIDLSRLDHPEGVDPAGIDSAGATPGYAAVDWPHAGPPAPSGPPPHAGLPAADPPGASRPADSLQG
ncbi:MAG: MotA/TolQ/ExbB proton channel family protein [Planctomycetota bacterium]